MAVEFDGDDAHIVCGSGATIDNIWDGGGSIACRIYCTDLTADRTIATKDSGVRGWILHTNDGASPDDDDLKFLCDFDGATDGAWHTPEDSLSPNTWHSIAITYNSDWIGNDPLMYIDGVSKTVTEVGTPAGTRIDDSGQNFKIGFGANSFLGLIEDFRVFTDILTPQEVTTLATGYRPAIGDEVMWFDMCSADGITTWPGANLVAATNYLQDKTVNNNDGDPTNTPIGRRGKCLFGGAHGLIVG